MSSSFKKTRQRKAPVILGCRSSVYSALNVISTGIPSLDHIFGGGLPIGTICFIIEDRFSTYSKIIEKYFLSEAVNVGNRVLYACASLNPRKLLESLPSPVNVPSAVVETPKLAQNMDIAWRYKNLPNLNDRQQFCAQYDFGKVRPMSEVEPLLRMVKQDTYSGLLAEIEDEIEKHGFGSIQQATQAGSRNVLRICIESLGPPYFPSSRQQSSVFLTCLRALVRSSLTVALVTIPPSVSEDDLDRLVDYSDCVIKLESFESSDAVSKKLYSEYSGLLHVVKPCNMYTLSPPHIELTKDLAFSLKRKKFSIEKLHLPPDISETASRSIDRKSCASDLEF